MTPAYHSDWIEQSIYTAFLTAANRHPANLAIVNKDLTLSYAQLLTEVKRYASVLQQLCPDQNSPVAIWLPNDYRFIVCMLAISSLGRAYLPLDVDAPDSRNVEILELAEIATVISAAAITGASGLLTVVAIDALSSGPECSQYESTASQDDLSYIIYTSGSTGKPKGVYQNQRNLLHDVMQYIQTIELNASDRCTLLYSPIVNGAIRDIYGTLLSGATLYMANLKTDGIAGLGDFLKRHQITVYHSLPGIFRAFLCMENAVFNSVRWVYLAGDRILSSDLKLFKSFFNDRACLYVGIGSTENATIYCQWILNHATQVQQTLLPLGYQVQDREFDIVDANHQVVPTGQEGQIVVTSKYMSLGYWNDPETTHKYFTQNADGSRTFQTGDIGFIQPDGMLYFLGRNDRQVKINGYRVEMDEVSERIRQLPGVKNVAVLVKKSNSTTKLVAFVELRNKELTSAELKRQSLDILPSYMLPASFYVLDSLPMLSNFKIDYQQLGELTSHELAACSSTVDETMAVIRQIWLQYIENPDDFAADIAFRDAGGSSMDVVYLVVELEDKFNIKIPAEYINVELKPSVIIHLVSGLSANAIPKIPANVYVVYLFSPQPGLSIDQIRFIKKLESSFDVISIRYPDGEQQEKSRLLTAGTNEILQNHFSVPSHQKYIFLGVCNGNLLAQAVAAALPAAAKPLLHINLDYHIPLVSHLSFTKRLQFLKRNLALNGLSYTLGISMLVRLNWLRKRNEGMHRKVTQFIKAVCQISAAKEDLALQTNSDGFEQTDVPLLLFISTDYLQNEFHHKYFWNKYYTNTKIVEVPYLHDHLLSNASSQELILSHIRSHLALVHPQSI
ncbi:hypothetical protein GCM10027037_03240 [Mucilaginibacter koreensis]